jgi:hypothetical protein
MITVPFLEALVLVAGFLGGQVVEQAMQLLRSIPPCCDRCHGTGGDVWDESTGGLCWDCRGTGHPHTGLCTWEG